MDDTPQKARRRAGVGAGEPQEHGNRLARNALGLAGTSG